ncbi:MAG: hypothetical protein JO232_06845, partial [Verrucomicrobia bacterium]|nr:hypothetical protein [Verrucomicrobiota bacterium]
RLIEIARTLAGNPQLLLLDEPGAGLNTVEKSELVQLLKRLGRLVAEGTPEALWNNDELRAAYLGGRKMVR